MNRLLAAVDIRRSCLDEDPDPASWGDRLLSRAALIDDMRAAAGKANEQCQTFARKGSFSAAKKEQARGSLQVAVGALPKNRIPTWLRRQPDAPRPKWRRRATGNRAAMAGPKVGVRD